MRNRCKLVGLALAGLLAVACGDDDDEIANLVEQCTEDSGEEQCELYRLINVERQSADVSLYGYDPALARAAQLHANDMADNDYFDHESLDGRSFSDRAQQAGYDGSPTGENIASASSAQQTVEMWMSSSGHRANLLSTRSTEIGIGAQSGLWVAVFGRE